MLNAMIVERFSAFIQQIFCHRLYASSYHHGPTAAWIHGNEDPHFMTYEEDAYIQDMRYLLLFQMVWLEELFLDDQSRNYILINWKALWIKTKTLKSTTINQNTLHRSAENASDRIRNYIVTMEYSLLDRQTTWLTRTCGFVQWQYLILLRRIQD